MTVHVIGCGSSAEFWFQKANINGMPIDFSLGINDALKHGYQTDWLVISNRPGKFPQDRLEIIKRSKPNRFFSPLNSWKQYFPHWEEIKLRSWDGHLYKDTVVHTDTSASIAIDLSRKLGASKIILWGIDMKDHKTYHRGNPHSKTELKQLKSICESFKRGGIEIYLGETGSELETFLPVWTNS